MILPCKAFKRIFSKFTMAANPTSSISSLLAQRFGSPEATYFAGNPLNRVSFKREDYSFLSQALNHPSSKFLLLKDLNPAVKNLKNESEKKNENHQLHYISYNEIKEFIGNPFEKPEKDVINEYSSKEFQPLVIFLGLAQDELDLKDNFISIKGGYKGRPYFAVDISIPPFIASENSPQSNKVTESINNIIQNITTQNASFPNVHFRFKISNRDAAIFAEARTLIDWNERNIFCGGCGYRTFSVNGGAKRICPPIDNGVKRPSCPTRNVITNLAFPRTDPTVIVAVVNSEGNRILLGRNARFPGKFYSCLAGFLEPAESIEEAVRREVWEESGVSVGRVVMYVSQPWPFPANIMLGCIAEALPGKGEDIFLGNDPELHDAKWFTFDIVKKALEESVSEASGSIANDKVEFPDANASDLHLPGPNAVAHTLIDAVVNKHIHLPGKL